ncbi:MAG: hypothetical protein SPI77_05525 [Corynebacterium sp.]|nr:hypothetical protein [Corynebacterium sp.]
MMNRLPREIYLRRRVAAVIIVVVVLALLWWLISAITPDNAETDQAAVTTSQGTLAVPAPSSTAAPTLPSTTDVAGSEVTTNPAVTSVSAAATSTSGTPKPTCELSDLLVTASADQANYEGDTQPSFYVSIKNPTAENCEIDLDVRPIAFEVFRMGDNARVWGDLDCNKPTESGTIVFPAGETRFYRAVWSRNGSAPEQCQDRQSVPAGAYYLHASLGDNHSEPVTFNVI